MIGFWEQNPDTSPLCGWKISFLADMTDKISVETRNGQTSGTANWVCQTQGTSCTVQLGCTTFFLNGKNDFGGNNQLVTNSPN